MYSFLGISVAVVAAALNHYLLDARHSSTAAVLIGSFLLTRYLSCRHSKRLLFPGPSGWPIIGNALDIPQQHPWITYSKWSETFGDIVHLEALGEHLVVLNSARVAKDLLDKRSSIYSDRPHFLPLQHYGEAWRMQRKIVAQSFSPSLVHRYYGIQELEARRLVLSAIDEPSTIVSKTKLRVAAIIMRVTYGYTVKGIDDPMITLPFSAMDNFSVATEPGKWLVDFIPQLRHLPEWTPGATFLRMAKEWRELEWNASWNPYLWCKKNLDTGIAQTPSLCATVLSEADGKMSAEDEATLVWAASSGLGGGLDTNMCTIFVFILAMLHYPHVQERAQAEIDTVVGRERLPSISDRAELPYVRSIISEVYRWAPATPLGLPHALMQDDVYDVYPEPMEFKPERFQKLDSEMQKVIDLSFGFGRRACPGSHFAGGTIFAVVSTLLATCSIMPVVDTNGKAVISELSFTSGTIIFPENVVCDLKPRSAHARSLLSQAISAAE
ncbi:cytochrome P450 [Laetiporus sulphureus 93-53]|uniref:Cytochrome P450 n=1 Tax=Laetiporus sulphureus 93-53 TaxID=1314785 RepID=A0A165B6N2_9APHY|nr:cytochrome P450 [Laetiporus sulphureus 93-53]KZT00361.1 cytochrome P450 [Laetiporus sulphureus 93-53]